MLALALLGCSKKAKEQQNFIPPAVPVRTAEIVVRNVPLYFESLGVIASAHHVDIIPQVQGQITKMHFEEGSTVNVGDLLYTIDEGAYEIKANEARAQLMHDKATLENAQKRLDRYKSLTNQDLIAKVEWDELQTQVALAEAVVKADEARLAASVRDLEHCQIRSPIHGKAGKTTLHPGNFVIPGASLLKIVQEDALLADFSLTEKEMRQLPDSSVRIEIYAVGQNECLGQGEMTFLDHTLDPKSGLIAARARVSKQYKPLISGQMVRLHLYFKEMKNAILVPLKSIKTNQSGPYVFAVKEDNTVEICSVKLGVEEKGMIVVEEGLDGKSKIVTEGQQRLFSGTKVEEAAE